MQELNARHLALLLYQSLPLPHASIKDLQEIKLLSVDHKPTPLGQAVIQGCVASMQRSVMGQIDGPSAHIVQRGYLNYGQGDELSVRVSLPPGVDVSLHKPIKDAIDDLYNGIVDLLNNTQKPLDRQVEVPAVNDCSLAVAALKGVSEGIKQLQDELAAPVEVEPGDVWYVCIGSSSYLKLVRITEVRGSRVSFQDWDDFRAHEEWKQGLCKNDERGVPASVVHYLRDAVTFVEKLELPDGD